MRMKVIVLIGLAVLLAATSPAFAGAFFGGGGGHGSGDFGVGNGVVSGVVSGEGFSGESFSIPVGGFDFEGDVVCNANCSSGTFDGNITVVQSSEPLAALLVGLGLLGARYIRRRV